MRAAGVQAKQMQDGDRVVVVLRECRDCHVCKPLHHFIVRSNYPDANGHCGSVTSVKVCAGCRGRAGSPSGWPK